MVLDIIRFIGIPKSSFTKYFKNPLPTDKLMLKKESTIIILLFLITTPHCSYAFQSTTAYTFVSPDNSLEAFSIFADIVDSDIYLSIYQISSPLIGEEILELLRDGKNVTIMVENSPAGGFPQDEINILSMLVDNGADVYFDGDEYRFYHGKY